MPKNSKEMTAPLEIVPEEHWQHISQPGRAQRIWHADYEVWYRKCSVCKRVLREELGQFRHHGRGTDGFHPDCNTCRNARLRERYANDAEYRDRINSADRLRRQDPDIRKRNNAAARHRYATDAEYRERRKAYQRDRRALQRGGYVEIGWMNDTVIPAIRDMGFWVEHTGRKFIARGVPDLLIAGFGCVVLAELKMPDKLPSPEQVEFMRRANGNSDGWGPNAYVVTKGVNYDGFLGILRAIASNIQPRPS